MFNFGFGQTIVFMGVGWVVGAPAAGSVFTKYIELNAFDLIKIWLHVFHLSQLPLTRKMRCNSKRKSCPQVGNAADTFFGNCY